MNQHLEGERQKALDWMHLLASAGIKNHRDRSQLLASMELSARAAGLGVEAAHEVYAEVSRKLEAPGEDGLLPEAGLPGDGTRIFGGDEAALFSSEMPPGRYLVSRPPGSVQVNGRRDTDQISSQ